MYIRTITRKNKNKTVQYVQLSHNYRHPQTGQSQAKILYNFGRIDKLDVDALKRLAASIMKFLKQHMPHAVPPILAQGQQLEFLGAKQLGCVWFLDELWRKLGIKQIIAKTCLTGEDYLSLERLIFGLVANSCLASKSALTLKQWTENKVFINGLPTIEKKLLHQAINFLHRAGNSLQKQVFTSALKNINLTSEKIYLTTTCLKIKTTAVPKNNHQPTRIIIAYAFTKEGIPVYCRVWPENTDPQTVLAAAQKELADWGLQRPIRIATEEKERVTETLNIAEYLSSRKQLFALKRSLQQLKPTIDCNPFYQSLEISIEIHVLLCWLGLLLIRTAELQLGQSWPQIKSKLENLQLGHHRCEEGEFGLASPLSPAQAALFRKLDLNPPPRYFQL